MDRDNVTLLDHPLVAHHLVRLRDVNTSPELFRLTVSRLAALLAYEATRDLTLQPVSIRTPIGPAEGRHIAQRVALVPILRAGLSMVDSILHLLPEAEVWHLGLYRDEHTLQPVAYYNRIPASNPPQSALILDPMLATGGSAQKAVQIIHQWGVPDIKLLSLIGSPQGVSQLTQAYPKLRIYLGVVDSHLNDLGYIVPGLGDAGDRAFNAVPQ